MGSIDEDINERLKLLKKKHTLVNVNECSNIDEDNDCLSFDEIRKLLSYDKKEKDNYLKNIIGIALHETVRDATTVKKSTYKNLN